LRIETLAESLLELNDEDTRSSENDVVVHEPGELANI
jgi:hypothetical protein